MAIYNHDSTGGAISGGLVTTQVIWQPVVPTASLVNGSSTSWTLYRVIGTVPAIVSGSHDLSTDFVTLGGLNAGGTATQTMLINGNLDAYHWDVIATGAECRPPDTSHSYTARGIFALDTSTNRLYFTITHDFPVDNSEVDAVRLRGPAVRSTSDTTETEIRLDDFFSTVSPIVGSIVLTADERTMFDNEQVFMFLREDTWQRRVRSQLDHSLLVAGGSATISVVYPNHNSTGGVVAAGTGSELNAKWISVSGGATAGSSATRIDVPYISGGAVMGGSAIPGISPGISGGVIGSSSASVVVVYNPSPSGGSIGGGNVITVIAPYISGGATVGSSATLLRLAQPVISGGAIAAPNHVKQQTYSGFGLVSGGIIAGGRFRVERLRFYPSIRRGYGLAMASDNILTNPQRPNTGIVDPLTPTTPTLSEDRFQYQHSPGWKNWNEPDDKAILPKIVQNRQGKHLPEKGGVVTRRDRSIARLS